MTDRLEPEHPDTAGNLSPTADPPTATHQPPEAASDREAPAPDHSVPESTAARDVAPPQHGPPEPVPVLDVAGNSTQPTGSVSGEEPTKPLHLPVGEEPVDGVAPGPSADRVNPPVGGSEPAAVVDGAGRVPDPDLEESAGGAAPPEPAAGERGAGERSSGEGGEEHGGRRKPSSAGSLIGVLLALLGF